MPNPFLKPLLAAVLLTALGFTVLPASAQDTGEDRRAIKACRAEAAARNVRVLRVGSPTERHNHDDRVIGFHVPMTVELDGRSKSIVCRYDFSPRRAVLPIPSAPSGSRPPQVPSAEETARACRRDAERRAFRFDRLVYQENLRNRRGNIVGRETALNLRRDGRDWRGLCTFDFVAGTSRFAAYRR